ncbi:uncharacterized protein N7496_000425 [Penicillium cataractarum]|uniref:F-box domain-containing protein n=1 Tax=Penicillium cataractarum TaxID=2100454 RepID=A0A9W9VU02_9EURO|nr:uncharacterized protein N7496_000425 [Penicillium cataractarum]KAJ5389357.1 hypothetical protein N7496_000425 [Penicillium cataractarum]
MEIDPEDEAFLRRFETLPKSRRQAMYIVTLPPKESICAKTTYSYRGLLERLRLDEWREVKAHAEVHTLQCDILGKLPPEITSLVARHLPLIDIIRLRRVSRRWQSILSSQSVCRAAVRKTLGRDPWVNSIPIPNTQGSASTTDSSHDFDASFASFVKRRYRLERGKPHKVFTMRSPVAFEDDDRFIPDSKVISYSNGICTWIGQDEDKSSVIALNLSTGEKKRFTTPNREGLLYLQISGSTIAALSLRGYCHVWNYDDISQFSSFRVPSLRCNLILINGKHIVLEYRNYLVHWSWDTRIARTIATGDSVITVAPHPSEDQITMIHCCLDEERHSGPERTLGEDGDEVLTSNKMPTHHLQTIKYTLNDENEWYASSSHPASISMDFSPMSWQWGAWQGRRKEIQPGQSSIFGQMENTYEEDEEGQMHTIPVYLSVEPNGLAAMHTFPRELDNGTQFVYPEEGIIYISIVSEGDWEYQRYGIAKSTDVTGPSDTYVSLDYSVQRVQGVKEPLRIFGDTKFLVFLGKNTMDIWVMDENAMDEKVMEEMRTAGLPKLVTVETV